MVFCNAVAAADIDSSPMSKSLDLFSTSRSYDSVTLSSAYGSTKLCLRTATELKNVLTSAYCPGPDGPGRLYRWVSDKNGWLIWVVLVVKNWLRVLPLATVGWLAEVNQPLSPLSKPPLTRMFSPS